MASIKPKIIIPSTAFEKIKLEKFKIGSKKYRTNLYGFEFGEVTEKQG